MSSTALAQATGPASGVDCSVAAPVELACQGLKAVQVAAGAAQAEVSELHSQAATAAVEIALAEVSELHSRAATVAAVGIVLAEVCLQY